MWVINAVVLNTNVRNTSHCTSLTGMGINNIRVIFLYQFPNSFNHL